MNLLTHRYISGFAISAALMCLTVMGAPDDVSGEQSGTFVRIRLRNNTLVYGQIELYNRGNYHVVKVDGKRQVWPLREIAEIIYKPDVPDGFITALKNRSRKVYRPPTEAEIFQMAIKELQNERKEDRRKRIEQAQGAASKLGLGDIVGELSEGIQDNLINMLSEDRELQGIIMDKDIQKTLEDGSYLSLLNNEKILNLMRNKKKVKRLTDAVLGKDEDKTKKKVKTERATEKTPPAP